MRVETPFGPPSAPVIGEVGGKRVAFILRHGLRHELPPALTPRGCCERWQRDADTATVPKVSADPIRTAYEALMTGDVDPLVSLIHPDMEWRGRRKLSRFWQQPPS